MDIFKYVLKFMLKTVTGKNTIRYSESEFFVFLISMVNVDGTYHLLKKEALGTFALLLNRMSDTRNSRAICDNKNLLISSVDFMTLNSH